MPVSTDVDETAAGAVRIVLNSLDSDEHQGLLLEDETLLLKMVLGDTIVQQLVKAQESLQTQVGISDKQDNIELCKEVLRELEFNAEDDDRVNELFKIIEGADFRSLVDAHDSVINRTYETPPSSPSIASYKSERQSPRGEPLRVVGLHKGAGESLGITLSVDESENVYIAKILKGSMIDRQGLLHVGDIIKAVNGNEVGKNPKEIQEKLNNHSGNVTLRVVPSYKDHHGTCQIFMKAHYDYDPTKDKLVPSDEVGLAFKKSDILEILDQSDTNWWQAKAIDDTSQTGIIPSQMLEENRRSQITPAHKESRLIFCGGSKRKKRKMMYTSKKNAAFDRLDMAIYEEVTRMPPFDRKILVLIGPTRVGRRTLKNKLIITDPECYGSTIPHTSRKPRKEEENGKGYYFSSKEQVNADIDEGKYLEWGEHEGSYYGTKIDTVRSVMRSGRMCILDVNPSALKVLKTAEFMPFVVFIGSPKIDVLKEINRNNAGTKKFSEKELQETVEESQKLYNLYSHYFDLTLVNDNFDETYSKLNVAIEKLSGETQWVPVNWVY